MLNATNLRKEYATILAVADVSFQVQRGEIFGLLGPNGAGKTTTIRMVLNIILPDGGTITYDGEHFSRKTRNVVGYLPEERGLYKKSKVTDTILYFAMLRGMQQAHAKAETLRWLDRFQLADYRDRKVEELSKGNQQKVQFISSIIHNPDLVVLDEPFSGLDPVNQLLFKDIFLELKQQGKAIIFSTHQMDQAEKMSDAICLINRGRVVLSGSVRDVKRRYGSNAVNIEFEGDGSFLKSLPGVADLHLFENSAELHLSDGSDSQSLLRALTSKLEIRKFELREPSLHSIFIKEVGGEAINNRVTNPGASA